jgi:hypothetical protein
VIEHVLGSALAALERSPSVLWREFSLFAPPDGRGMAGIDASTDVAQLAGVALSMLLARPVTLFDLQHRLPALLDEFSELTAAPSSHHISPLRLWLERALHVNGSGYQSASDAQYDVRQLPNQSDIAAVTVSSATPSTERKRLQHNDGTPPHRPVLRSIPRPEEPTMPDTSPDVDAFESFPSEVIETVEARVRADQADVAAAPKPGRPSPAAPPVAPGSTGTRPTSSFAAASWEDPRRLMPSPPQAGAPTLSALAVRTERSRGWLVMAMAGAILAQSAVIGFLVTRPVPSVPSSILIESAQPGDAVVVNGQTSGATPFELKVGRDLKSLRVIPSSPPPATQSRADAKAREKSLPPPSAAKGAPVAALPAPRPRNGAIRLVSAIDLQVSEGGEVLGSTAAGPIALSPGTHQLALTNEALGYHRQETITIKPGQSLSVPLIPPDGLISINALPWANCQIGNKSLGETPLANLKVPIGEHEVICRHPELGEVRRTVVVRAGEVARLSLKFGD